MSIVSAKIDDVAVMFRKKCRPIAVTYNKNDSGAPEPADFTTAPQLIDPRVIQGSLRPTEDTLFKGEYVPLRAPNPEGSADFWASMPFATPSLDIESDVPFPANAYDSTFISKYPDVPVEYPYSKGIRAGSRPIEFDDINEPTAMLFRKGKSRSVAYAPATINYDLGMDELKQMSKRQF
jgi:hypothetical protein